MEERLSYLEQKIGELTYRVNELEEMLESKSAPAVTDAESAFYRISGSSGKSEAKISTNQIELRID